MEPQTQPQLPRMQMRHMTQLANQPVDPTMLSQMNLRNTVDATTRANNPFPNPTISIPARCGFFWMFARGQWIWHPGEPACGPAGSGGPAGDRFVFPQCPAGSLCGLIPSLNQYVVYETKYDRSQKGTWAYLNESNETIQLLMLCNDHDDGDMYKDNSGEIVYQMAYYLL